MRTIPRLSVLCLVLAVALSASSAEMLKYRAKPGSKMRIEGTSTFHPWHAESVLLGGRMELDPIFPTDPASKELAPGKVNATADVAVVVRTFKCSSGAAMDAIFLDSMAASKYPKIDFKLTELVFKEFTDNGAIACEATGDLTVHGQTKAVSFPVQIHRPDSKSLKITGSTDLKMTDFGITPPAPKIAFGAIKTGDDVKLSFEWNVQRVES
jgi:polyisoprenoid-binding protein YceI